MRNPTHQSHSMIRRQMTAWWLGKAGVLLAAGLILQAACLTRRGAEAAKPVDTSVTSSVTFMPRPGDRIFDDGAGAYIDGQSGISCVIHRNLSGDLADLTLHDSTPGNGLGPRRLRYDFSAGPVPTTCQAAGGVVPAELQPVGLTVQNLGGVPIGSSDVRKAVFFLQEGQLQLFYPLNPCTSLVHVSHDTASTWTVWADPGEWTVFSQAIRGQGVPISYWEMPFRFQVTLP